MNHPIVIHWLGFRKDSNRGSVWGWFTLAGRPVVPARKYYYSLSDDIEHFCYTFSGKIGKSINIEKCTLTYEFLNEIKGKQKNFKEQFNHSKITSKWGKAIDDELSMFLTYETLLG